MSVIHSPMQHKFCLKSRVPSLQYVAAGWTGPCHWDRSSVLQSWGNCVRTHSGRFLPWGREMLCPAWVSRLTWDLDTFLPGNTSSLLYSFSALVWFLRRNWNSNQVHNWKWNMSESACFWRDKDPEGEAEVVELSFCTPTAGTDSYIQFIIFS